MTKSKTQKDSDVKKTLINKIVKPLIPNFPGKKAPVNFKPNARFQSINRGRR